MDVRTSALSKRTKREGGKGGGWCAFPADSRRREKRATGDGGRWGAMGGQEQCHKSRQRDYNLQWRGHGHLGPQGCQHVGHGGDRRAARAPSSLTRRGPSTYRLDLRGEQCTLLPPSAPRLPTTSTHRPKPHQHHKDVQVKTCEESNERDRGRETQRAQEAHGVRAAHRLEGAGEAHSAREGHTE